MQWGQGQAGEARRLLERTLAIGERVLGPEHPRTARSLHHLGLVLRDQGDHASARALVARAVAIYERTLGPEHSWALESHDALAALTTPGEGSTPPRAN